MKIVGSILGKFADKTPAAVMVNALSQRVLNADQLNQIFEEKSEKQYHRKILFSTLVELMLMVAFRYKDSPHQAYCEEGYHFSKQALYDKLNRMELSLSEELVKQTYKDMNELIKEMSAYHAPLISDYHMLFLDGNCIEATHRRLKKLRTIQAAPLPGKSLVIMEQESGLVRNLFLCEDGYAQERALLDPVVSTIRPHDLIVMDRNFCVTEFLRAIDEKKGFFIARHHKGMILNRLNPSTEEKVRRETGEIRGFTAEIGQGEKALPVRVIRVSLKKPTRDGESFIDVVTNLPNSVLIFEIAEAYRNRWSIESLFQRLEKHLHSEVNTLGHPRSALFSFSVAVVGLNLYAVVMAAIQAAHPKICVKEEVSDYAIASEIVQTSYGIDVMTEEEDWRPIITQSPQEFTLWLLSLASKMRMHKFKKALHRKRYAKTPKTEYTDTPHVSTARILAGQ